MKYTIVSVGTKTETETGIFVFTEPERKELHQLLFAILKGSKS